VFDRGLLRRGAGDGLGVGEESLVDVERLAARFLCPVAVG